MATKTRIHSKVSRLPRTVREEISRLLFENEPAEAIVQKLADQKDAQLTIEDIAAWQKSGHQDWLEERERLAELDRVRELARRVNAAGDGAAIQEASLQIAAARIYELLSWFNPRAFKKKVLGNLADYARIVNMLVRLSDGGLKYERYRAEVAERKATMQKELENQSRKGGVSPQFLEFMERELKLL